MNSLKTYKVPHSSTAQVGNVKIGGEYLPVLQSMANSDTNDIQACVEQAKKIACAGGEMVRFTTQGLNEVASLNKIVKQLKVEVANLPIVADVHFSSKVAAAAVPVCDKVRINPGNFLGRKDAQSTADNNNNNAIKTETKEKLKALITLCKKHKTALRIGVNHGSLSSRIMNQFGDTPEGMVASAMEYLLICKEEDFDNVIVSLKSSNSTLMTKSVRLLVYEMVKNSVYYPVHLGVTESGDGLEGRIKSVVGIAPLLLEGIGDTIRISLTEPPENEIPVAKSIIKLFPKPETLLYHPFENLPYNPFDFQDLRQPDTNKYVELKFPLVVSSPCNNDPQPDIIVNTSARFPVLKYKSIEYVLHPFQVALNKQRPSIFISITTQIHPSDLFRLKGEPILVLDATINNIHEIKQWLIIYHSKKLPFKIILRKKYNNNDLDSFALHAAGEFGLIFSDRLIDGCWIENNQFGNEFNTWLSFNILQATRLRITATEYIACPSCGRTQFDIEKVLADVKKETSHLKGLKIAVMGCIVNGPGEMADADYGYIGAGNGRVNIFKGKTQVRKNIPQKTAINELKKVIMESGDWSKP